MMNETEQKPRERADLPDIAAQLTVAESLRIQSRVREMHDSSRLRYDGDSWLSRRSL